MVILCAVQDGNYVTMPFKMSAQNILTSHMCKHGPVQVRDNVGMESKRRKKTLNEYTSLCERLRCI